MNIGYMRVSTKDQNEDRQRIAMRDAGVAYAYPTVYEIIRTCICGLLGEGEEGR